MTVPGPTHGSQPREYLKSVDIALLLIHILRDDGSLSVSKAATTLGVSPSTVHRSMAMLVYRGFATQSESRTYLRGPALTSSTLQPGVGQELISAVGPYMAAISAETKETCHLLVLSQNQCHFLHTVEGTQPVRVGIRRGQVMPAEKNSGGLIMLAEYSASELRALYPTMPDLDFDELRRILNRSRQRRFAINNGLYEHDVSAVAACLHNDLGDVLGALSVAIPTERFRQVQRPCTKVLLRHIRDLNRRLATVRPLDIRKA